MAAPPLFDLAGIQLDAVAVTSDEVGRLNPQCGDMRHLDHVIWLDEALTRGLGIKRVRPDEFWVPGHIPGRPLLPGVLMIEAAAQLSSVMYRIKIGTHGFLGFTRCDETIFRGQVTPGQDLLLLVREVTFRPRRFVSDAQGWVDGNLVFETRITGMAMEVEKNEG